MKRSGSLFCAVLVTFFVFGLTPHVFASTASGIAVHESGSWTFDNGDTYLHKYTITLSWDALEVTNNGLSHLDIDLSNTLMCPGALFNNDPESDDYGEPTGNLRFNDLATYEANNDQGVLTTYDYDTGIDGTSNNELSPDPAVNDGSVIWGGYIDVDQGNPLSGNLVRYQQPLEHDADQPDAPGYPDPGATGVGEFSFYSHFGPVDATADIVLKLGLSEVTIEDAITGELPYCVPEPATLMLLSLGGLFLRKRRA